MFQTIRLKTPGIIFGMNTLNQLGEEVKKLGGTHVLIITDKGVVGAGILDKIIEPLKREKINLFFLYKQSYTIIDLKSS